MSFQPIIGLHTDGNDYLYETAPVCFIRVKAVSEMQVEDEEQMKIHTFLDIFVILLSGFHKHPALLYQNQTEKIFTLPETHLFRSNRESQVHSALLYGLVKRIQRFLFHALI